MEKIKEIQKKNTLGLIPNAIKILTEEEEKLYFCSFANRNTSFDTIYALWKNVSKYAKNHIDKEELSESDEEIKRDLDLKVEGKESPV